MSERILGWDPYQDESWGKGYTCAEQRSCGAQVEYMSNAYEPPWVEASIPYPADKDAGEVSVGIPVPVLKALLAEHGLHIVDAKDKAVLDAMERMRASTLCWYKGESGVWTGPVRAELWTGPVRAELARREGK